jgi:trimeric autotransporter adhesin
VGYQAGINLTTGSHNIDIGNRGVAGESQTIRIGTRNHIKTFIAGIRDVTTGNADAIPVLIDSAGQLGTMSSSRRFKKEIKPMDRTSEAILGLKPMTFHYKSDSKGTPQFGLIAEEVAQVNPDLVVRDENGEIHTVRYEAVNAMLLNEFLKEHRKVQELEANAAEQQREIKALVATVKDQAAQIQKVRAALGVSKPALQVVNNP